jgi:hypothetical protein
MKIFCLKAYTKCAFIACIESKLLYISDKRDWTMRKFWEEVSTQGSSIKQMVLCSDAEKLNQHEVSEVLSLLPDFAGKDVLELGAGIGFVFNHFTY